MITAAITTAILAPALVAIIYEYLYWNLDKKYEEERAAWNKMVNDSIDEKIKRI